MHRRSASFLGFTLVLLLLAACGGSSAAPAGNSPAAPASGAAKPSLAASTAASALAQPAASPAASGQLKTMKIATPIVGSAFSYLYAARDLGFFKDHGLDAQFIAMPPANAVAALQAGDLDYAAVVGSIIRSALKGIPERVVFIAANRTLTELMKRKGLAGKYQTVSANSDETRALLVENGEAAAAILDVSNSLRLEKDGYPLLARVADFPEAPFSGMGASQATLQKNRDFMKAGLQASLEGVDVMRSRKADVVPITSKVLNLTPDQAGAVYDQMHDSWTTDGRASQAAVEFELTNDQQTLELKEMPKPEQVFDFSLLDELGKK